MLYGLRKYGTGLSAGTAGSDLVRMSLRKSGSDSFATGSDWSPTAGDVKVSKDGGAQANIGTLPSYSNGSWEFTLSGTELSAKTIRVIVANASIINDDFTIETFANASGMYSTTDYTDGVRQGLTALPNASVGGNGGLPELDANGDVSAKLGAVAQAMVLQLTRAIKGTVWIVDPVSGNDSNAGTWASPFATPIPTGNGQSHAASSGDLVFICGATCALGSSRYVMNAGVTLAGMGMMATTITSSFQGEIIRVASNCTIRDLTVQATASGVAVFAEPISNQTVAVTGVLIENVRTVADTDGLYFTVAGTQVVARRCEFWSNWDCCYAQNAVTIVIEDSHCFTTAQNVSAPTSNSSIQAADGAVIRLVRTPVINVAGNTQASRNTNMIHARVISSNGARIEIINSPIYLNVDGSAIKNLVTDANTTIVLENSAYDPSLVPTQSGTLIDLTAKDTTQAVWQDLTSSSDFTTVNSIGKLLTTNLDTNVGSRPTAAQIATGIWQDLTASSDFTTVGSIGKLLGGYVVPPTVAQIATGIFTDTTAGDFTTAGSLGHVVTQWGTMVNGSNQFTTSALSNAPSGGGGGGGSAGDGNTPVNQNTGGTNNLLAQNNGVGIGGASIKAYLTSEWTANPLTAVARGQAFSQDDGTWATPMMLNSGLEYTIVFRAEGFAINTVNVTV